MKLVQFKNGKWGVRAGFGIGGWEFYSIDGDNYRWSREYISKYCQGTEQQARKIFDQDPQDYKIIKSKSSIMQWLSKFNKEKVDDST